MSLIPSGIEWPQEEPILTNKVSKKNRNSLGNHATYLRNDRKNGQLLENVLRVSEEQRPEYVAMLGTEAQFCNKKKAAIKILLTELAPLWSLTEKRRFLKTVASRLVNFEFATWAKFVRLGEIDLVMLGASSTQAVVDLIRTTNIDVQVFVGKSATLLGKEEIERRRCVRASRYFCPNFESRLLGKFTDSNLESVVREVCREYELILPPSLRAKQLPHLLRIWMKAFRKGELSGRDFVRLTEMLASGDQSLRESALTHAYSDAGMHALLRERVGPTSMPLSEIADTVPCWEKKDGDHRRDWEVVAIHDEASLASWKEEVAAGPAKLFIAYRLNNDAAKFPRVKSFVVSFPGSARRFWWGDGMSEDARGIFVESLATVKVVTAYPGQLRQIFKAQFGVHAIDAVGLKEKGSPEQTLSKVALSLDKKYCAARRYSPIVDPDDFDESHLYHMVAELELVEIGGEAA